MRKRVIGFGVICFFLMLGTGCSQQKEEISSSIRQEAVSSEERGESESENIGPEGSASAEGQGSREWAAKVLVPDAPGTEVYESGDIALDATNVSEGYIMLNYNGSNTKVKFQVTTPEGVTYTYLVTGYGEYMAYPLSGGSGTYHFTVYEAASVEENLYAVAMTQELTVNISDEFLTYLYPNYYVDFDASSACVKKGEELAQGCDSDLEVISSVYGYVTENITYDYDKAETVQSGYAPYPDDTLASGTGICFDYASLMSAMLRSQRIPTRLEVGYVGELYHAWISCYVDEIGWVDSIIEFDGKNWTMMDPTMAAGDGTEGVRKMQEESGYITKYMY